MAIELYAQDSNDVLHSTVGEYSLMQDKWIKQPSADTVTIDDDIIDQKAQPIEYAIDQLQKEDPQLHIKIQNILLQLRRMRQTGLEAEGEYSIENLAYKKLRNTGYLERLKQLLQTNTMSQLAVESVVESAKPTQHIDVLANHLKRKQLMSETEWNMLMQHTDAVEDPRGQWEHPGRCTMIPSNQITMQRVAYPVLGIDDSGFSKIMHPEQQYTFPGTRVFEIPMNGQQQTLLMQIRNALTDWNNV
jgi:hypothetical protein